MRFYKKRTQMRAQIHTKKIEELTAYRRFLAEGVISYIHRVRSNLEDPMDIENET